MHSTLLIPDALTKIAWLIPWTFRQVRSHDRATVQYLPSTGSASGASPQLRWGKTLSNSTARTRLRSRFRIWATPSSVRMFRPLEVAVPDFVLIFAPCGTFRTKFISAKHWINLPPRFHFHRLQTAQWNRWCSPRPAPQMQACL